MASIEMKSVWGLFQRPNRLEGLHEMEGRILNSDYDGDWNYRDFPNFNPNADIFTSGEVYLDDEYKD